MSSLQGLLLLTRYQHSQHISWATWHLANVSALPVPAQVRRRRGVCARRSGRAWARPRWCWTALAASACCAPAWRAWRPPRASTPKPSLCALFLHQCLPSCISGLPVPSGLVPPSNGTCSFSSPDTFLGKVQPRLRMPAGRHRRRWRPRRASPSALDLWTTAMVAALAEPVTGATRKKQKRRMNLCSGQWESNP